MARGRRTACPAILCRQEEPDSSTWTNQPLLPLQQGQLERRTHDYKRNGTTSLFAALDLKNQPGDRSTASRPSLGGVSQMPGQDRDSGTVRPGRSSRRQRRPLSRQEARVHAAHNYCGQSESGQPHRRWIRGTHCRSVSHESVSVL